MSQVALRCARAKVRRPPFAGLFRLETQGRYSYTSGQSEQISGCTGIRSGMVYLTDFEVLYPDVLYSSTSR